MAPAYSKIASADAQQISDRLIHHLASDPAPICYVKSSRASAKHDDSMYHEFEYSSIVRHCCMLPENKEAYSYHEFWEKERWAKEFVWRAT